MTNTAPPPNSSDSLLGNYVNDHVEESLPVDLEVRFVEA